MSYTATVVRNIDASDDERIAWFKTMEIPSMADTVWENWGCRINISSCSCLADL
jgi:hypothetical protein